MFFLVDTTLHIIDPKYPGAVETILNLGDFWEEELLRQRKEEIKTCTREGEVLSRKAHAYLATAQEIYERWCSYFQEALDLEEVEKWAQGLAQEIFALRRPQVRHLFAGTVTPQGVANYMDNITADCRRRFILRGGPGTGKTLIMEKIMQEAVQRGYRVDVYHCGFDPDSLDMLVISELQIAVVDGSPPHQVEPKRVGDVLLDTDLFLRSAVFEQYRQQAAQARDEFQVTLEEAVRCLAEAKKNHDYLEDIYVSAMDFEQVDRAREQVLNQLLRWAATKEKGL